MFKSTTAKYVFMFVIIIVTSFFLLSGIITSMIRSYFSDEKENSVIDTTSSIASALEIRNNPGFDSSGYIDFIARYISMVINYDKNIDVVIALPGGDMVLSTLGNKTDSAGLRVPETSSDGKLGHIDETMFEESIVGNDRTALIHRGKIGGLLAQNSVACLEKVVIEEEVCAFVVVIHSLENEANFINTARQVIIISSVAVMIAAAITTYLITQRVLRPIKNITASAKKFGKGDFSARVTVYGRDEVAELASAFNNMADSLGKLDKMRSSFLANVSHDLRTPMTTIAGFIDGIKSGAIPQEKQGYYLDMISNEIHRLSRLVAQLLDISRLESGDRKMNFTTFDVAEVARLVLISFEQHIEEKNLDVEFDAVEDKTYDVLADKDAIHQVLYNLCHNAVKFARDGGKFKIKIEECDTKKVKLSVIDEGEIISEENQRLIFDQFFKTDSSRGLDKNGVGLGLYICKTIIDAHDEKIGVETVDNKSTRFYFTLKAKQ